MLFWGERLSSDPKSAPLLRKNKKSAPHRSKTKTCTCSFVQKHMKVTGKDYIYISHIWNGKIKKKTCSSHHQPDIGRRLSSSNWSSIWAVKISPELGTSRPWTTDVPRKIGRKTKVLFFFHKSAKLCVFLHGKYMVYTFRFQVSFQL